MEIKCVYNTGKNISNILYELYGYSIDMEFRDLTIDKVYIVYAIFIMKGVKWYLICSDKYNGININYPEFFPSSLFDIVNHMPSQYWISKEMKDDYSNNKNLVINIGFPSILKEEFFYGNLVEGYNREVSIFNEYKNLIDMENL